MTLPIKISTSLLDLTERYCQTLTLSMSQGTVKAYERDVKQWLEYMAGKKINKVTAIQPQHIIDYLGWCKRDGKSDSSINWYYMSIRSFCRFLRRIKAIPNDLTEDITAPKNKQKAPRIPTVEEMARILEIPDTTTENGCRDRAILELIYSSGLRASELCDLTLGDITNVSVTVRCGKREKPRTVPITKSAHYWSSRYVNEYRGTDRGDLFQTMRGSKIRRQLLCALVSEYARTAGLEGVSTHSLRHACATHLLAKGADIRFIQEVLGHSSIVSTQRYTSFSSESMHDMFNQYHPRRNEEVCALNNS